MQRKQKGTHLSVLRLQGTQAATATSATSPLDGFEAAVRVARNDASCRIPIVYRYAAPLVKAPLFYAQQLQSLPESTLTE